MSTNGRLPSTSLVAVQGSIVLPTAAAASWLRFVAAARAAGYATPLITSPAGGYRTYAMQVAMRANPSAYGVPAGVPTAYPGTSVHGTTPGCVDISYRSRFGAMVGTGNAAYSKNLDSLIRLHGWYRSIPSEGWHYQYSPKNDKGGGGSSGSSTSTPVTPVEKKRNDDMPMSYIKHSTQPGGVRNENTVLAVADGGVLTVFRVGPSINGTDLAVRVFESRGDLPAVPLNDDQWAALVASYAPAAVVSAGSSDPAVVEGLARVEAAVNRLNPPDA